MSQSNVRKHGYGKFPPALTTISVFWLLFMVSVSIQDGFSNDTFLMLLFSVGFIIYGYLYFRNRIIIMYDTHFTYQTLHTLHKIKRVDYDAVRTIDVVKDPDEPKSHIFTYTIRFFDEDGGLLIDIRATKMFENLAKEVDFIKDVMTKNERITLTPRAVEYTEGDLLL